MFGTMKWGEELVPFLTPARLGWAGPKKKLVSSSIDLGGPPSKYSHWSLFHI